VVSAGNATIHCVAISVGVFRGWHSFNVGDVIRGEAVLTRAFEDESLVPGVRATSDMSANAVWRCPLYLGSEGYG